MAAVVRTKADSMESLSMRTASTIHASSWPAAIERIRGMGIFKQSPARSCCGLLPIRLAVRKDCGELFPAQVLSPQHGSATGVAALNRALQARLNPPSPSRTEVQAGGDVGDRLIVGKNNYQTLCFNGETGEIVAISPDQLTLRLEDAQDEREVVYAREDWAQLQLAYAITIHRAQGSSGTTWWSSARATRCCSSATSCTRP